MNALSAHQDGKGAIPSSELAKRLDRAVIQLDLMEEVEKLRQERSWRDSGHGAKALVKHPDLRLTLNVLKAGQRIPGHKTEASISIQTILGRLCLHLPERTVDLPKGSVLALDKGVLHDVEALEESAFLLTLAWQEGRDSPAETAMGLNKIKTGLIFGTFTGGIHLAWSALVAGGLAQGLLDWITALHFLNNPYHVGPFAVGTAIGLVAFTTVVGFVCGWTGAFLWNAVYRFRGRSASAQ